MTPLFYVRLFMVLGPLTLCAIGYSYHKGIVFLKDREIAKVKRENAELIETIERIKRINEAIRVQHEKEIERVQNRISTLHLPANIDELRRLCPSDPNCKGSGGGQD